MLRRKRLRRRAMRDNEACWICSKPIDLDADWRSPSAFTLDHLHPISLGGQLSGPVKLAHRGYNFQRAEVVETGDTRR